MQTNLLALDSPLFWATMLLTLGLVTWVVYTYGGKDKRLTFLFALFAFTVAVLAAGYDDWLDYLQNHFIGRFDDEGVPYRVSRPGLLGVWDAWPLWLIPTLLISSILVGGLLSFILAHSRRQALPTSSSATTTSEIASIEKKSPSSSSSSHTVTQQLEFETLKHALKEMRHKFEQAQHAKSEAETALKTLQQQTLQASHSSSDKETQLSDQLKALEIEREAYLATHQELTQQLASQTAEIAKLKALVAKLVQK